MPPNSGVQNGMFSGICIIHSPKGRVFGEFWYQTSKKPDFFVSAYAGICFTITQCYLGEVQAAGVLQTIRRWKYQPVSSFWFFLLSTVLGFFVGPISISNISFWARCGSLNKALTSIFTICASKGGDAFRLLRSNISRLCASSGPGRTGFGHNVSSNVIRFSAWRWR